MICICVSKIKTPSHRGAKSGLDPNHFGGSQYPSMDMGRQFVHEICMICFKNKYNKNDQ